MKLFAPTLECFAGKTDVSRDSVKRHKQAVLESLPPLRQFEVVNLRIHQDNNRATAEFRIRWATEPARVIRSDRQRLTFGGTNGDWQILCEDQLVFGSPRELTRR
jgi:hypothetical protein